MNTIVFYLFGGGVDIFYGDPLGYFGQFKELDRFNLGVKIGI